MEEERQARRFALLWLSRRGLFSQELKRKLIAKGISESVAEYTVLFCQKAGYIDDEAQMQRVVEQEAARGKSSKAIRYKLQVRRGVDSTAFLNASVEQYALQQWLRKHAKQIQGADRLGRIKIIQRLLRQGFSLDLVRSALASSECMDRDN